MNISINNKIKALEEIKGISNNLRENGKKIITLNGSFDIFHPGHIYIISEAKKQGDVLVVGVNSDKSYKEYKDKRGPIIDQDGRALIIASLEEVDYVVLFDEPNPIDFIKAIKPNIHCNGAEYGALCVEAETVLSLGGQIHLIENKNKSSYSTSNIIAKIIDRFGQTEQKKAIFLDRDGILNKDTGYTHKAEDFQFEEGSIELLKYLKELGYVFIVITNQSGIGRGYYKENDMEIFHEYLKDQYHKLDIHFEEIYFCPHNPETEVCDCRKPGSVLFQKAVKEHNIIRERSFAIGDKISDCTAAKRIGIKTIFVGKGENDKNVDVDFEVESLLQVKSIITK